MKIEFEEQCPSCDGTGVYVGMAERDGYAVECHTCHGTGKHLFKHEYAEFTGRKENKEVKQVVKVNPGIVLGVSKTGKQLDFGGLSYDEWKHGITFSKGTEMREFSCPAWWYQLADYSKKPDWETCLFGGRFDQCQHFKDKHKCWERFDLENNE